MIVVQGGLAKLKITNCGAVFSDVMQFKFANFQSPKRFLFILSPTMIGRIRTYLIRFSRLQTGTVSYLTLVQEAELGLNLEISHEKSRLNEMLAEISSTEFEAGRPLLSCLVKVQGSKGQGDNFYKLCEKMGLGEWRTLKQDEEFLKNLVLNCRDYWRDEANFQKFS